MTNTRQPVVAGMFYSGNREGLKHDLEHFFSRAKAKKRCRMVVSPHAGYVYSGQTAAYAISSLEPAKKFIILGPNHPGLGAQFSVMSSGSWRTPLGDCRIDRDLAAKLESSDFLEEDELAHMQEHSIEVQLPFLQLRFKDFSFSGFGKPVSQSQSLAS